MNTAELHALIWANTKLQGQRLIGILDLPNGLAHVRIEQDVFPFPVYRQYLTHFRQTASESGVWEIVSAVPEGNEAELGSEPEGGLNPESMAG